MADQPDQSQKTEDPTQKRLEDARKKGDVAKSQEVSNWIMLATATLILAFFLQGVSRNVGAAVTPFLEAPHNVPFDANHLLAAARILIFEIIGALALPFGALIIAAIGGNLLQFRPVITTEKMQPKLEKISPLKGAKRLLGLSALVNFAKGLAKLGIVGAVAGAIVWGERDDLTQIMLLEPSQLIIFIQTLALKLMGGVLAVFAVIAVADFGYQKFDFQKRQRMTKQEVKDEHKQTEGDPLVKAKLRQIRMERGRQRMMAEVPNATVVITNPTHYAVALKYDANAMGAPLCLAKGVNAVALRIRAVAEEHDVPVIENPPLARALHGTIDIGDEIPPEHYKAVASVIGYLMKRRGRALGAQPAP
jgi:flagellar biosynthetic protein FlhB